ncbi:MAG: hypothetical protein PHH33_00890 [Parabacteroides sp.]|jgi:hypothetical protein|nr:hypothetical protein [Parabacteroides sp.]
MKKNTDLTIGFAMTRIETKQFAVIEGIYNPGNSMEMNIEISVSVNIENRLIVLSSKFMFLTNNQIFIILEIACTFEINKENWNSFNSETQLCVPANFVRHLAMHTVGTARGVLHAKIENTPHNCIIIPPINVSQIIGEDFIIQK